MNRYIAICPEEVKSIVAEELKSLGATDILPQFKAVYFSADMNISYKIHLNIRSASRILRIVREGSAKTQDMIRIHSSKVNWSEIIPSKSSFLIDSVVADRGPSALNGNLIGRLVREGFLKSYERAHVPAPKVDLEEPKSVIVAYLANGHLIISVDTSGKSLHKRGYKQDSHPAPLKETLASAILGILHYDGSQVLLDPMCGSGTIPIEAAYIALNKSALIHRKKGDFGFEHLKDFDNNLWRKIQEEARSSKKDTIDNPIFASDISNDYVTMAQKNALKARVEKFIKFDTKSFLDISKPADTGILIANLPYGERIQGEDRDELTKFYSSIGDVLKQQFRGWTAALLVADNSPHKFIGLKPRRKIPFLNGSISCKLLIFDLYDGSKKNRPQHADATDGD